MFLERHDTLKNLVNSGQTNLYAGISLLPESLSGTPEAMYEATPTLMERCAVYPNFVLSFGCDILPSTKWKNICAFFAAAAEQK